MSFDPRVRDAIDRIANGAPYLEVLAEVAGHPITTEVVVKPRLTGLDLQHRSYDEDDPAERYPQAAAALGNVGHAAAVLLFARWARAYAEVHGTAAAAVAHLAPRQAARQLSGGRVRGDRRMDALGWPPGFYLTATMESGLSPDDVVDELEDLTDADLERGEPAGPSWEPRRDEPDDPGDIAAEQLLAAALALTERGVEAGQAVRTALEDIYRRYEDDLDLERVVRDARDSGTVAGLVLLVDEGDDEPVWTVDGLLVRGEVALLAAPAFSGKTPFAIDLAAAVASGRDVLGRSVKQGRVLYATREESASEVKRWLRRLGHDLEALRPHLLTLARPEWDDLATPPGGAALARIVADHGPFALIVIDTLGRFVRGPENSTETYSALHANTLDVLKGLGAAAPTVLLLDHMSTEGSPRPRGATAKLDVADTVWLMRRTKGDRDADVTRHRLSHRGFTRIPRPSPVSFERVYDDLGRCTFSPALGASEEELDEEVELTIEAAVLAALPVDSYRQLETILRDELGDNFKRNELRRVLDHLLDTGQIEPVQGAKRSIGYVAT